MSWSWFSWAWSSTTSKSQASTAPQVLRLTRTSKPPRPRLESASRMPFSLAPRSSSAPTTMSPEMPLSHLRKRVLPMFPPS